MKQQLNNMEILNIKYNKGILLVKALNRSKTIRDAALLLGIDERSVYTMIIVFAVKRSMSEEVLTWTSKSKWLDKETYK